MDTIGTPPDQKKFWKNILPGKNQSNNYTLPIMKRLLHICILLLLSSGLSGKSNASNKERDEIISAMKRATTYMMDSVGYHGAFLWEYSFENKRYWGELEARRTMGWTQGKGGTPAMGDIMLDAYHATGDEYYYESACRIADALIRAQLDCGGWNYCFDMTGEASLIDWYESVSQYKWPAQEFLYYCGNATFDDMASIRCCEFLLRIYLEKNNPVFKPALGKAIDFVLKSQYPVGGWPQRFPLSYEHPYMGFPDYSSFITLNDGAMEGIINFLINCYNALGDKKFIDPIYRAMHCIRMLQYESPVAGWGLQYNPVDLKLATARPFEPAALASNGTTDGIEMLLRFYRLTGDKRFLEGVPAAFGFLETIKLNDQAIALSGKKMSPGDILCPTFIDPQTLEPFFLKRVGESLYTGGYEKANIMLGMQQGYSSVRVIPIKRMKSEYESLLKIPVAKIMAASPLTSLSTGVVNKYAIARGGKGTAAEALALARSLNGRGYWPSPLNVKKTAQKINMNPGRPKGLVEQQLDPIPSGITTETYIDNIAQLISYLLK
jgi:PelA/Pel-15E family pectate lyase